MTSPPVTAPARFAPIYAVGYSSHEGELSPVTQEAPLPVAMSRGELPDAVVGNISNNGVVGPFSPAAGIPVLIMLSGNWTGSAALQRSIDGGATRHPVTVAGQPWARFSGNVCEAVWEEHNPAASLHIEFADIVGTVIYRLGH